MWTLPTYLTTPRLVLRPCDADDFDAFASFMADAESTRYLLFTPEQRTPDGARQMFDAVVESYATEQPIFVLAVAQAADDRYIGSCGLSPIGERTDEAECYYTILRPHWGKGYASEALTSLLSYAFDEMGFQRIEANVGAENPASARVAEKAGMQRVQEIEAAAERPHGWKYELRAG